MYTNRGVSAGTWSDNTVTVKPVQTLCILVIVRPNQMLRARSNPVVTLRIAPECGVGFVISKHFRESCAQLGLAPGWTRARRLHRRRAEPYVGPLTQRQGVRINLYRLYCLVSQFRHRGQHWNLLWRLPHVVPSGLSH